MKLEDFLERDLPLKNSKLKPFMPGILELHKRGYSATQIQKWIASEGVQVTARAISMRVQNKMHGLTANPTPKKEEEKENEPQQEKTPLNRFKSASSSTRAEREAFASQFIKDNTLPPTVKRRIEKNAKKEQS